MSKMSSRSLYYPLILTVILSTILSNASPDKPNIILIVMDDWGFNDVSWHDHTNTKMPFLDSFVREQALMVDTFYTYPLCSISRTALLTGRYPIRYGLQSSVIENGFPFGLSIFENLIVEDLKDNGYNTAMIGKWHLGFHRHDLTPLRRGFDEFRGSLSPMIHFYKYAYQVVGVADAGNDGFEGLDLYINSQKITPSDTNQQYLTYWERDQYLDVLNDLATDTEHPFFMYVAMHASHSPHDAPSECFDIYDDTQCVNREWEQLMECAEHETVQAQTSCADDSLETMITTLQEIENGEVWDNTLIIFLSDNGAPAWDSDNSPLRGAKKFLYEAGVRTPSFIAGGYLNEDRYGEVFGDGQVPFHVTDWYPTILSMAGIPLEDRVGVQILDGLDQWDAIQNNIISDELSVDKREFLYNAESKGCQNTMCGAYRYGPYKLIWISDDADDQIYWYDFYSTSPRFNDDGTINEEFNDYLGCGPIPEGTLYENQYDSEGNPLNSLPCNDKPCLFNLIDDPCEYVDLSTNEKYSDLYNYMYNMLMAWYTSQQLPLPAYYSDKIDPRGDPNNLDGFWQPWIRDYNHNDAYEDFEDVMKVFAEEMDINEDVTQNKYYTVAMEYKVQWEMQQQREQISEGDKKQSNIGVLLTISVAVVVFIGVMVISCWMRACVKEYRKLSMRDSDEYTALLK